MIRPPVWLSILGVELVAWAIGKRGRMRIEGRSMLPTLAAGEFVLLDSARRPEVGDLVAARPRGLDGVAVVKRVSAVDDEFAYWLISDNEAQGTSSEHWGTVPAIRIDGVVTVNLSRRSVLASASRGQQSAEVGARRSIRHWLRR